MMQVESIDRAASCIGACAAAAVLNAAGLPPLDLGMGFAGAMFSLGFIKPTHWGNWLNPPSGAKHWVQVYYWGRRIALVAFMVAGAAVLMTGIAQATPHFPGMGWTGKVISPIRSLIGGFLGLSVIPLGVSLWHRYLDSRVPK